MSGHARRFIPLGILFIGGLSWAIFSGIPRETPLNSDFSSPSERPVFLLDVNGMSIKAEAVSLAADVRQGLSDRPSMEHDRGMLFFLDEKAIHPFWMNRMHFPLDIIWLDGNRVVEIAENLPPPGFAQIPVTHTPKVEADTVLELNAGVVAETGLRVGDRIGGF